MRIKRKQTRDAQRNCSPPADQCQAPLPKSRSPPFYVIPPQLIYRHDILWYGISLSLVQVTCTSYALSSFFCIAPD